MTKQRQSRPARSSRGVPSAVRPIAADLARVHGLVLWDLTFERRAGRETLRVACDKVGGVGSDELALYAEDLSRELDHTEAVPGNASYVLEVTSPGAERRVQTAEQFRVCRGRTVHITFSDGRPASNGAIGDVDDEVVEVETAEGVERVRIDDIARAQLRILGMG